MQDEFTVLLDANRAAVRTAVTARVVSFSQGDGSSSPTATVMPMVSEERLVDGEYVTVTPYEIPDVPVVIPGGAKRGVTFGLARGDRGILLYRHRSHDELDHGSDDGPVAPKSHRRMNISDVVFLCGFSQPGKGMPANSTDSGGALVLYFPSGESLLIGDSTAAKALALAQVCYDNDSALRTAVEGHQHSFAWTSGGGASLTDPTETVVTISDPACDDAKVRS